MSGTLYGVGLGPGDPELMTVRASRLISAARVVAYPSLAGAESFARSIAAALIPGGAREIVMDIPMTTAREPAQTAYDRGAEEISTVLEGGVDVVCLCEGDPFFYGSFMYLFARLSERFAVEVVPGVTSMTACAAVAGLPLAARTGGVSIVPGTLARESLAARLAGGETVVLMKVGRHLEKIRAAVSEAGREAGAVYVERATLAEERVLPLAEAPEEAPYFSMIIVPGARDPWL
ncbi:precorrin-2 C(20)-methyltransferase [Aestuariibius sp. 2305UL40-4]|uniref:precorrin-2 C(20)-methyltransferase n=1 Tax=Aestuariibius violaceus TaxID=3234132 RepID=UPI00345E804C